MSGTADRRPRAMLVGPHEESVREILERALAETGVDLHVGPQIVPADMVIAIADRSELSLVFADARLRAAHAPILVVTTRSDDVSEALAAQLGARAYWTLERPVSRLKDLVTALIHGHRPR